MNTMILPFKTNDLILFTGDSITDCDRDRSNPASLGFGYVSMVAQRFEEKHSDLKLHVWNTGISGDRTANLLTRWDRDCIELQPDWVSILIGVNNAWWDCECNAPIPDGCFEIECRRLLERIRNETAANVILCSPFLLRVDTYIGQVREHLDPKIAALKTLADEFEAIWVDFDAAFSAAQQRHIPTYWAEDGVHPTSAGHALMAETWLGAM